MGLRSASGVVLGLADAGREREFYLGKLREIEILVSARLEAVPPPPKEESDTLLQVQAVLYATEEVRPIAVRRH